MNEAVLLCPIERAEERKKKQKHIEVETVPTSELPIRLFKKRTGQLLGSFRDNEELDAFLDKYPLTQLASKPTRRKGVRH